MHSTYTEIITNYNFKNVICVHNNKPATMQQDVCKVTMVTKIT